jgi:hypothetical protein
MIAAETLFSPYTQAPAHVAQDYEDDDLFELNGSIQDLVANQGFGFKEFYSFVKDRVVFLNPDTSIVAYCDAPSHHEYTVDMIFDSSSTKKKKTLHIAGVDAEATSIAINGLLELFVASHKDDESIDVTFKCFATNPRKPLGSLNASSLSTLGAQSSCKLTLIFQFLALNEAHCHAIFNNAAAAVVELRQCTVDGLGQALQAVDGQNGVGPKKVKISCAQSELVKVTDGLKSNSTLGDLDLLLHFILATEDIQQLTHAIQSNTGLQRLCLEYLDMDDQSWEILLEALEFHPSLRVLDLAFTEKFADSVRRLDPERRHARTKAVLKLVQTNKNLIELTWPKFQQDEELVPAIQECLDANKTAAGL